MGISAPIFTYLASEATAQVRRGRCLTLGRQYVPFSVEQALALAAREGAIAMPDGNHYQFPEDHPLLGTVAANQLLAPDGTITDKALFNLLGFREVLNLDVSAFEGATLLADLNEAGAARKLGQKFDLVFDGGTMEHVFHVPNVLANIFDLLEVGGCVLHWSPSNNHVDHGFYQFSPTLFCDYYSANEFEILDCRFMAAGARQNDPYEMHAYVPGSLDEVSMGGLDDRRYEVAFLGLKTEQSISGAVPQQGRYRRQPLWTGGRSANSR